MNIESIGSPGRNGRAGYVRRAGVRVAVVAACAAALFSSPATALTVAEITPFFFDADAGFDVAGVSGAGRTAAFGATPDDAWTAADVGIRIDQRITRVHQLPGGFTLDTPAIVDSTWTITNTGADELIAALLVFTSLDPLDAYAPGGSKPLQGLDGDLLQLLAYSHSGMDYLFGAAPLPDLSVGESAEVTVRYVVASPLRTQGGSRLLAPMGVSLLRSYVRLPEPSTLLLMSMGLTLSWGFRRRHSSKQPGGSTGNGPTPS